MIQGLIIDIGKGRHMSQTQDAVDQKDSQKQNETKNFAHRFLIGTREVIAILLWGYVITKLFIFDIDIFLVENLSPNYLWLIPIPSPKIG
jgi:hypothetical protein